MPIDVDGQLCVGDEPIVVPGPPSSTRSSIGSIATVTATGFDSGKEDTAEDPAGVTVDFLPKIALKKYASAPDGSCSMPLDTSKLEDDTYETYDGSFQYCYAIRVGEESEECMSNFVLTDTGVGGIGSSIALPGKLCSDMSPIIVPGPANVTIDVDSIDSMASVTGKGVDSGKEDTASDGAGVKMLGCPTGGDMENQGSQLCPPPIEGVVRVSVIGTEEKDTDVNMLYDIQPVSGGSAVQFKVMNPFAPYNMNMFIQYNGETKDGGDKYHCDDIATSGCDTEMEPIVADCLEADGKNPFTVLRVYFLPTTAELVPPSFIGDGTDVHQCCNVPPNTPPDSAVQYTFILRCSCPEASSRRRLGESQNYETGPPPSGKINIEEVLSSASLD